MFTDLKQAIRLLFKAPGFTSLVVAVLAIGIGATTAIFSIVNGVLLKPLPFPDAGRLITIQSVTHNEDDGTASVPDVIDWQSARTVGGVVGYTGGTVILTGHGEARTLRAAFVTGDLIGAVGAMPLRGRSISADDAKPGAAPVAVIAERLWADRFDRNPSVVGAMATLDGQAFTIVGIMPDAFDFPIQAERVQVWLPVTSIPVAAQFAAERGARFVHAIARLQPAVTLAQALAELTGIAERLAVAYPASNAGRTVRLVPLQDQIVRQYRTALTVLLAAVGVVLLIACANVANLLLARGVARRREIAIRAALGAGRGRIVSQLLTESLIVAIIAGAAGVLLSLWGVAALVAASPIQIPRLHDVHIDRPVLLFAALLSAATGIVFGLVPAFHVSRSDASETLKDTARGSGAQGARTRQVLVVAEVALSLVLLAGAGLLARTLVNLQRVDLGFVADRAVAMEISLPDTRYATAAARVAFYRRTIESLRAIPGATSVAAASTLPLMGNDMDIGFRIEGRPRRAEDHINAAYHAVSSDYFKTMGIRVVRGRRFTDRDDEHAPGVLIISETMARKYWPNEDPLGKRVTVGSNSWGLREIVGIVGDVKESELAEDARPEMYTPFPQTPWAFFTVVLRTEAAAALVAPQMRAVVVKLDPDQPPGDVATMTHYVERAIATPQFTATLVGAFATLATALAGLGLYGLLAYGVAQRRREIGIRLALGARPSDVRSLVVSQAIGLGAIGLALGTAAAFAITRALASLLFGVSASDPLTFTASCALLLAVVATAAYLPARRATRVDPMVALRAD
jgi:putative ABC transport system permease protein